VTARPSLRALLAIGLLAASTLALQVLLTRIFASVLFYHFGFLAISLALLGTGGGALIVYLRPGWFDAARPLPALAGWAAAFAVLTPVVTAILVRLDYDYNGVDARFALNLGAACVLSALPFFAAGIAIAHAVRAYVASFGRVYFSDLVGAGLGAALIVPLLWIVSAPTLTVSLGVAGGVAALLLAPAGRLRLIAVGAVAFSLLTVLIAGGTDFYDVSIGGAKPAADRWTPISRVQAFPPKTSDKGVVIYDRVVGEMFRYHRGDPYPDYKKTQEGPESIAYQLAGPGDALIIGGGGGRDIFYALSSSDRHVDVIELNRGIRRVVDDDLGAITGSPYTLPRVSTAIGDGRSTLAHRDKHYASIQIGFTDTFSQNSAQGFALTEANLYTREAVESYIDHLAPGGVLMMARPIHHSGEEALRATVLAMDALEHRGVADARKNVIVVRGTYNAPFKTFDYGTVLARKKPWTAAEIARIESLASSRGTGILYAPDGKALDGWRGLGSASSVQSFCSSYHVNVCPPTDDKPFFFYMKRLSDLGGAATSFSIGVPDPMVMLLLVLGILLVLCAIAFVLPLVLVRPDGRPPATSLSFFGFLGVGFLVLEIVLIQRFVLFLGFPTYALSVVLCALLISTGIGALLTTRTGLGTRRTLIAATGFAALLAAIGAYGLEPLLAALLDLSFPMRVLIALVVIAPLGVLLGMAMPIGLKRLSGLYPAAVPWGWAINGFTSVVASVLAIAVAIQFGFAVATLLGALCYLGACLHALRGRWPSPDEAAAPQPARELAGATR
jgi:spermidine synthase